MNLSFSPVVRYSLAVIDAASGKAVCRTPFKRNLIPDVALARMVTDGPAALGFSGAGPDRIHIGTGTAPVRRDSGSVTFTVSGGSVTASQTFFESGDSGRILKLSGGGEFRLTYVSGTSCTITGTGTATAETGTIWYVERTGLTVDVKTSTTAVPGSPTTRTHTAGVWTWNISRLFTEESATVTYTEAAWYQDTRLLGLDAIPGGIQVLAGQQLAIYLQVSMGYAYGATSEYIGISGWSVGATKGLLTRDPGTIFSNLNCLTLGHGTVIIPTILSDDRALHDYFYRHTSPSVAIDTSALRRRYTWVIPVEAGALTNINSIALGQADSYHGTYPVCGWNLDSAMAKEATYRLTLSFDVYFSRTLTN